MNAVSRQQGEPSQAGCTPDVQAAAADLAAGRMPDAIARIALAAARWPDDPQVLGMLGRVAIFQQRPAEGLAPLQRAVATDPASDARIWLSLCLDQLGRPGEALREIEAAAEHMPQTAPTQFALGMVFERFHQHERAAHCYRACLRSEPDHPDAHHRYGRVMHESGRFDLAVAAYGEALRRCATNGGYHTDLSSALSNLGRFDQALAAAEAATRLTPDSADAHNNAGHALLNLNRSREAITSYDRAVALRDGYARARFGRALAYLKSGDFARGWQDYEWRWRDCQAPRDDLGVPAWQGEDIAGQTILLHAEQGLGDTLQFVRFAPQVAARGARVVLEVPRPLLRLLRRVDGVSAVIPRDGVRPPIDRHCPMASLPLACGVRLDTIPAAPYLRGPAGACRPDGVAGQTPGMVVGLVWAGDPRVAELHSNLVDRRRSTTLDSLSPLFEVAGIRFVSFQFGAARGQMAGTAFPVADAMDGVTDFADTAARMAGIDLLISVDTSMVHLAGGLGVPVWMLSRFDGCWRWLEGRDDSRWYPTMRIFRQTAPGDWPGVVAQVATALRRLAATRTAAEAA